MGVKLKIIFILVVLFFSSLIYADSANSILSKQTQRWDITFQDTDDLTSQKTEIKIDKVAKEVDKVIALIPRATQTGICGSTGCNLDSVQCDAVTEKPICPDGSVLNKDRDMCQKNPDVFNCANGYVYNKTLEKCVKPLVCPDGGIYVLARHRCEVPIKYRCPDGYTEQNGICVSPPLCASGGIFNRLINKCEKPYVLKCPSGWIWSGGIKKCERNPSCSNGSTYSTELNKCISNFTKSCVAGYSFSSARNRCERNPNCPGGTNYNKYTNRCEQVALSSNAYNTSGISRVVIPEIWQFFIIIAYEVEIKNGRMRLHGQIDVLDYAYLIKSSYSNWINIQNGGIVTLGSFFLSSVEIKNGKIRTSYNTYYYGRTTRHYSNWIRLDGRHSGTLLFSLYPRISLEIKNNSMRLIETSHQYLGKWIKYMSHSGGSKYCKNTSLKLDGNVCYKNPTCLSGGVFDGANDKCYKGYLKKCIIGNYDSVTDRCITLPNCHGGILDVNRDKCQISKEKTCELGKLDSSKEKCIYSSTCLESGILNPSLAKCKDNKIPISCPKYTDNKLNVCYEKINYCQVSNSFPKHNTLEYSNILKTCLTEANIVCASSLAWNGTLATCEAIPVCNYGVYNPENDFCFAGNYSCPIDPSLPCKGTEKFNHWCSPWKCNSNNKCGYAYCLNSAPSNSKPWMLRSMLNNIKYTSNSNCTSTKCDLVKYKNISYCGAKSVCPKGFGVYEKDNKCYVDACPDGTTVGPDGNCYGTRCPDGTVEQKDGTCL